eukprot:4757642-Ditylum_brightwellii.AAC.1
MAPEQIDGKDPAMRASYMLNHLAVCAFHRIMTEAVFQGIVMEVAKVSIEAAQEVEHVMTLLKRKIVVRDSHGNIGIGGSLDMH